MDPRPPAGGAAALARFAVGLERMSQHHADKHREVASPRLIGLPPIVLPAFLTPQKMLDALEQAARSGTQVVLRSVLLQGTLGADPEHLPAAVDHLAPNVRDLAEIGMLAACGLGLGHMPSLHEGSEITGKLRAEVAADWGMDGVPVVAGGGDNIPTLLDRGRDRLFDEDVHAARDAGEAAVDGGVTALVAGVHPFDPRARQVQRLERGAGGAGGDGDRVGGDAGHIFGQDELHLESIVVIEQARDLDSLTEDLGRAGALRQQLMQLPGPVMRPANPQASQVITADGPSPSASASNAPAFILPVQGRLVTGFGASTPGQPLSRGIALATGSAAQVIAPAAGRVAFAGPYRGYGSIIIVDHGDGWISLVTGLSQIDVHVGEALVAGSPLGLAGTGRPVVTLELRHNGEAVNPLDFAKAQ
mgnify:CR=1 FL=1